jgi:ribulose-phosphate 3-epimerase
MDLIIAPSLLAADFGKLKEEIEMVNESEAQWLHLDIMDGRFVPNISYGMMIVEVAKKYCTRVLDTHLMILEPERYIEAFAEAGSAYITVHQETCPHLHRTIQQIKNTGAKAGVSLNPSTPVSTLEDVIEDLDLVLIMSVNPGFGGQKFIYRSLEKIKQARKMIDERNSPARLEVDGGIGLQNAAAIIAAGADTLVAGSSVFKSGDPKSTIRQLKELQGHNNSL